jgi:L-alanine-DL-glutamate epimerase-like enolase superfamily enzyme
MRKIGRTGAILGRNPATWPQSTPAPSALSSGVRPRQHGHSAPADTHTGTPSETTRHRERRRDSNVNRRDSSRRPPLRAGMIQQFAHAAVMRPRPSFVSIAPAMPSRRQFIATTLATAAGAALPASMRASPSPSPGASRPSTRPSLAEVEDAAFGTPVFDFSAVGSAPVVIDRVDLLFRDGFYVVRVHDRDGGTGVAVGNELHMGALWLILLDKIVPFFLGKDARNWEALLDGVYRHRSNYKLQGVPFWIPLANLEFAVLDLLGRRARRPVHDFFGGLRSPRIEVYQAFSDRHRTAAESVEIMARTIAETGARAAKFKVGGRMSRNADSRPGRTEAIIPLARERLGPDITLYADSNGSYDVPESIRIGRLLEAHQIGFFEEPVPFDRFGDTLAVADALDIPIAGGEQDSSLYNFAWMLAHGALQIAQPDLFYFGGFARSLWVARMAAAVGAECVPHISGTGLGYLYMLHFAGSVPNAGRFHEFKGAQRGLPYTCPTSSLEAEDGFVTVPTGPGLGVELDPDWLAGARLLQMP